MGLPKHLSNFYHFQRRLQERHNMFINYNEYMKAVDDVRFGGPRYLIEKETNTRYLYWVTIKYKAVKVVYSSMTKDLITVLYR